MSSGFTLKAQLNLSKVTESKVKKEILNLSSKKVTRDGDIPAKILKKSVSIYIKEIAFLIKDCIEKKFSLMILIGWCITHTSKKEDISNKENYWLVSILHMSKR